MMAAEGIAHRFEGRPGLLRDALVTAIEAAVAEEREACAKLVEGFCLDDVVPAEPEHLKQAASYLAAAIRARKQ